MSSTGERDDGAPDLVLGEVVQRQVGQAGVFGDADAVLAAGPAAVAQFEVGQLPAGGVGGERGDPVPVGVGDAQLRAGVGPFLAHDHPHPGRPRGQVQQPGDVGDPRAVADLAVAVVGRGPAVLGHLASAVAAKVSGRLNPTEYDSRCADQPVQELVRAPRAVGADQDLAARPASRAGVRAAARSAALTTRDVVGGGVRAGVSLAQQASPAAHRCPSAPWSTNAHSGWKPNPRLNVGAACSLSECAVISVASVSMTSGRSASMP